MPIKLNTASGGGVILTGANTASDKTITVPASDGTMVLTGVSGNVDINAAGSNYLTLSTNTTERARIDSSGNLLVGTGDNGQTTGVGIKSLPTAGGSTTPLFSVVTAGLGTGSDSLAVYSTGASAYRFRLRNDGQIFATSTTISAISDQRFKENIRDLDVGISEILSLKPRTFDWKYGKGKNIKNDRGFIAQEFEQVFPDLIDEWKDPSSEGEEPYKSVRQDLIPVLVKAIQEQQQMIETLQDKVAALEAK